MPLSLPVVNPYNGTQITGPYSMVVRLEVDYLGQTMRFHIWTWYSKADYQANRTPIDKQMWDVYPTRSQTPKGGLIPAFNEWMQGHQSSHSDLTGQVEKWLQSLPEWQGATSVQ